MIKHSTNDHIYMNELQVPKSHFNTALKFSHNVWTLEDESRTAVAHHSQCKSITTAFILGHICSS